jgi:Flp pilus assembly protein TadD
MQLDHLPEAEAEARAAVMANAKSPRAHDLLGQILARQGAVTRARTEFEAALNLNSEFGPAQLDLAEILIEQGQARTALELLEKAQHSPSVEIAQRAHAMLQQFDHRE